MNVVTGLGVVSPVGVGEPAFFAALDAGTVALAPDEAAARLGVAQAARVGEFGARAQLGAAVLRRMPRMAQMMVVAAKEALAGAAPPYDGARVGVVIGTGLGTLEPTIDFMQGYLEGGPEAASPLLFPSSVMNAAAGLLALECKLRGPNSTVNHRDASPLGALALAADLLALGRADAMVVGAVDELSPPALTGYAQMGGLGRAAMRPYDQAREGMFPGESAVALVLEREEDARRRGARVRARLAGLAERGEDRPRIGWGRAPAWPEAARVVRSACGGRSIDWVAGGGNGGALDERELDAIGEGLGRLPPVSSVLAQTGESLSSAMLRVAAALYALERQVLPGTAGLLRPIGRFAPSLLQEPRRAAVENVLVASFAQGGADAALVVSSP
jgi:3-oxoacyl-[acyl-carrier-protein] synthase II